MFVPGIECLSVGAVGSCRAHCEFVAVGFAEADEAGFLNTFNHGSVKRAHVIFEHFARGGARPVACDKNIFVCNGNAGQRRSGAFGDFTVGGFRLFQSNFRTDVQECI